LPPLFSCCVTLSSPFGVILVRCFAFLPGVPSRRLAPCPHSGVPTLLDYFRTDCPFFKCVPVTLTFWRPIFPLPCTAKKISLRTFFSDPSPSRPADCSRVRICILFPPFSRCVLVEHPVTDDFNRSSVASLRLTSSLLFGLALSQLDLRYTVLLPIFRQDVEFSHFPLLGIDSPCIY